MSQQLDTIGRLGRLISGRPAPEPEAALDWTDPRLLGWSDLVATAVWPALGPSARVRHQSALDGFALAHALNSERNAAILRQLERIAVRLGAIGIAPVVVKGAAHLALGLWPSPGSRLVADIDLLVAPDDLEATFAELEAMAGLGPQARGDPAVTADTKHMAPLRGAGGPAPVEIHHTLFAEAATPLLPRDAVVAGAERTVLGATEILVPSPTHRVLHAVLHGLAGSGTYRAPRLHLRDLLDIHFMERAHGDRIDWAWIAAHLTARGWASALEITNQCLDRFVGMPPPFPRGDLRARLDAARWRWQLEHPHTRRFGEAANLWAHMVWSLSAGGTARQRSVAYLRQPGTYRRAYRRYILGRQE